MAEYTAGFEAGVNGNTVSTAGGEANLTAWTRVFGVQTYSNAQVAHGSLSLLRPSAFDTFGLIWDLAFLSDFYGRFYMYATAFPGAGVDLARFNGGGAEVRLALNTSGTIRSLCNGVPVDGATTIALNQWIRIEFHFIASATVGLLEVKLFNTKESTVVTETIAPTADRNTGASPPNEGDLSGAGAWGADTWFDSVIYNATSYPGPAVTVTQNFAPVIYGRGAC